MNSNNYYITAFFIPCNTDLYYSVPNVLQAFRGVACSAVATWMLDSNFLKNIIRN